MEFPVAVERLKPGGLCPIRRSCQLRRGICHHGCMWLLRVYMKNCRIIPLGTLLSKDRNATGNCQQGYSQDSVLHGIPRWNRPGEVSTGPVRCITRSGFSHMAKTKRQGLQGSFQFKQNPGLSMKSLSTQLLHMCIDYAGAQNASCIWCPVTVIREIDRTVRMARPVLKLESSIRFTLHCHQAQAKAGRQRCRLQHYIKDIPTSTGT